MRAFTILTSCALVLAVTAGAVASHTVAPINAPTPVGSPVMFFDAGNNPGVGDDPPSWVDLAGVLQDEPEKGVFTPVTLLQPLESGRSDTLIELNTDPDGSTYWTARGQGASAGNPHGDRGGMFNRPPLLGSEPDLRPARFGNMEQLTIEIWARRVENPVFSNNQPILGITTVSDDARIFIGMTFPFPPIRGNPAQPSRVNISHQCCNMGGTGMQIEFSASESAEFTLDEWMQIVYTYDDETLEGKLYTDGEHRGTFDASTIVGWDWPGEGDHTGAISGPRVFKVRPTEIGQASPVDLARIVIYDRVLSESEVAANYIPEPATLALLGLGGLALLRRRGDR